MKYYKEKSKVRHGVPTNEVGLTMTGEIVVGKFVDRDRPDYQTKMRAQYCESLGERFVEQEEIACSYPGRSCACCHKRFGALHRLDHAPALMREDHSMIEWDQLRPEQLPEILSTSKPVCWNCHIATTFRRVHPELVVDRKRTSAA